MGLPRIIIIITIILILVTVKSWTTSPKLVALCTFYHKMTYFAIYYVQISESILQLLSTKFYSSFISNCLLWLLLGSLCLPDAFIWSRDDSIWLYWINAETNSTTRWQTLSETPTIQTALYRLLWMEEQHIHSETQLVI